MVTATRDTPTAAGVCCADLSSPLGRDEAEQLATTIKAIADPARLQILSLLRAQPDGEACGCEFVTPLGIGQPTVSHHLKVLYEAGVVERERRGKWIYYRLPEDRLPNICRALL